MSRLAKHAMPKLDDARLARQWSAIASRPTAGRRRSILPALSLAVAALAAIALIFSLRKPKTIVEKVGVVSVESTAGRATFVLADGSRITTSPDANLSFLEAKPNEVRVALSAGAADFDVRHDPARSFIVTAGELTIVDTGTRFHVEHGVDGVSIRVSEGSVRLERPTVSPSNLAAGDSWSSIPPPVATNPPVATVAPVEAGVAPRPTTPHDDLLDRFEALSTSDPDAAYALLGDAGYRSRLATATAKQLFAMGDVARMSKHPNEAVLAFDALRKNHRDDARAGLAAVQVGRIRQDVLHDPSGADEAYRDAIALAPDASFREDAESRRIAALEATGNGTACAEARDAYLARYPNGVYVKSVSKRCGGK